MRTLIVAGSPVVDFEPYRSILSSAGVRIAVDRGADLCFALGWTPDLFVGDADSVSPESMRLIAAHGVRQVLLSTDKNVTDLSVAIRIAVAEVPGPMRVTAILGGRTDHLLVAIGDLLAAGVSGVMVDEPTERAWVLTASDRAELTLAPRDALVSVLAGPEGATVTLRGFRWDLDEVVLEPLSGQGLSNVILRDTATVKVHRGTVLVHTTYAERVD